MKLFIAMALFVSLAPFTACSGGARHSPTPSDQATAPSTIPHPTGTPQPPPPLPTSSRWEIRDIATIDGRRVWILRTRDLESEILATDGTTWTEQYRGGVIAAHLQFADQDHGWVVGANGGPTCHFVPHPDCHGALLSTTDGGLSWQESSPSKLWLRDVSFIDSFNGWALGSTGCGPCQTHPVALLRTLDGGASWTETPIPLEDTFPQLLQLIRTTPTDARIFERGQMLVTSDGGDTWTTALDGCTSSKAFSVITRFVDAAHGLTLCEDGSAGGTAVEKFLYSTADGGGTWSLVAENLFGSGTNTPGVGTLPMASVEDLSFSSELDGWLAVGGPVAAMFSTRDGGVTWKELPWRDRGYTPARVAMLSATVGALATIRSVWMTGDAGATWQELPLPAN